jgi:hypothetical protein
MQVNVLRKGAITKKMLFSLSSNISIMDFAAFSDLKTQYVPQWRVMRYVVARRVEYTCT